MGITLYTATIPVFRQILGSVSDLLENAEAFCKENTIEPAEILQARLAEDMLPFAYQIKSTAVHSAGAIEGVRSGSFSPDTSPLPESFAALRARVAQAEGVLAELVPEEVEAFVGRPMRFVMGSYKLDFAAENFLLSFSQPNFFFHAAAAYSILRMRGLPLGKRHFMGRMLTLPEQHL